MRRLQPCSSFCPVAARSSSDRRGAGLLEAEILAALWSANGPLSVEEIRQQLTGELAHTTVSTILVRLLDKGAVTREAGRRGYLYQAVLDQAGLTASRMRALLNSGPDRAGVLSQFIAELDAKALKALRRALEEGGLR